MLGGVWGGGARHKHAARPILTASDPPGFPPSLAEAGTGLSFPSQSQSPVQGWLDWSHTDGVSVLLFFGGSG